MVYESIPTFYRYEWECRQRQLQREQRHRERIEAERLRPPSPPPVVHYSEHEATLIAEQLKGMNHLYCIKNEVMVYSISHKYFSTVSVS